MFLFNLSNHTRLVFKVSRNISENIRYTFCLEDMQTSVFANSRRQRLSPLTQRTAAQ